MGADRLDDAAGPEALPAVSDETMQRELARLAPYTLVLLRRGPNADHPDVRAIVWEHGRRNFALRARGDIAIVAPVRDDSPLEGLYVFNTDAARTEEIMAGDPCVAAGIFSFEVHPIVAFPGDALG